MLAELKDTKRPSQSHAEAVNTEFETSGTADLKTAISNAIDNEHLRLLRIFHYITGGGICLIGCLFFFHIFAGYSMLTAMHEAKNDVLIPAMAMMLVGTLAVALFWGWGYALIYAGQCLASRKRRGFLLLISAFNCLQVPTGTILGVSTLLVLNRDSVKESFSR